MVNLLKSGIKTLGRATRTGLDNISGAFQNPITFISKPKEYLNPKTTRAIFRRDTQGARIGKTLATAGTAAALTLGAGTAAGRAAALNISKRILAPKTFAGKVGSYVGAPIGLTALAGMITRDPVGTLQSVEKGSGNVGNFLGNIYQGDIKGTLSENPFIAAGAAALLGGAVLSKFPAGTGYFLGNLIDNDKMSNIGDNPLIPPIKPKKDKDKDIPMDSGAGFQGTPEDTPTGDKDTSFQNAASPQAPGTEDITTKPVKRTKKRTKKKAIQPIRVSQRVDVRVNAANKRYLNKHIHIKQ